MKEGALQRFRTHNFIAYMEVGSVKVGINVCMAMERMRGNYTCLCTPKGGFFCLAPLPKATKTAALLLSDCIVPGSQIQPRFKGPSKARYGNDTGRSIDGSG